MSMTLKRNQGEVWIANLNPGRGTEAGKTRPVLIIQSQILLDIDHPSTLIIPLTTRLLERAEPLRLRMQAQNKLVKNSDLLIDPMRAIDNQRLIEGPLVKLSGTLMKQVYLCINEVLGSGLSLNRNQVDIPY